MIDEYLEKWLIKANNDLKVAENESHLTPQDMVTDAICFHSQQAVEKYLKAFLIFNKIDFDKSHKLEYLLELCIEADNDFSQVDIGDLSFYAVEVRYPDDFYIPTEKEAKDSLEIAIKVKQFIFQKLNIKDSDIKTIISLDENEYRLTSKE
ncbi:MAG TPA: HEPN domain-containing protein [Candidatus Deferrimicrobium sp.]|nr:HEPN domain-containing protein [Candidatus Deferrimicrobium sp.]